ncbi:MAG TPA: histidine phosphatase family protein [Bryobacteraceae bacterium]|nr:histidine phosphatase family protein [Bryobacteraceae bacterium]
MQVELWLVRHGETEWSRAGKHTGRTDLPLTPAGEQQGRKLARLLRDRRFDLVLTSPLQRARETCRLAGFGGVALHDDNLLEYNYGDYEGRTTAEIRSERPNWSLWSDGVPGGETIWQAAARAQAVIDRVAGGSARKAIVFGHGHILRILASCWLGLPPETARLFAMTTASVNTLGYERETRVLTGWNAFAS